MNTNVARRNGSLRERRLPRRVVEAAVPQQQHEDQQRVQRHHDGA